MTRIPSVRPFSFPYEGVLIERPCVFCDTVNYHFEGLCQDGPCAQCGEERRVEGRTHHDWVTDHTWLAHTYLPADITIESPAFKAMLKVVRETGFPSSYTSDLFRDYQNLTGTGRVYKGQPMEDERFVWVLRQMGTHMFRHDGYGRGGLRYHIEQTPDARFFIWNRFTLEEVNADTASAVLAVSATTCHGATWHDGSCTHTGMEMRRSTVDGTPYLAPRQSGSDPE